ncbi:MAG: efflux RND transporter periplasmic adaptor subunit, partial [Rhodospirillales bacterium]|nr:efflux RND transporter periplasmic adaptor subunit [Rhodospirillales bacterium]
EISRRMQEGPLVVHARLPNLDLPPATGTLAFINNAVNVATGTIDLKATFENADERLVPGQFVDVVLTVSVLTDALVVPAQAVQTGQNGTYAFVVRPDQTVEMRPLSVRTLDDGRMIAETGLAAGETVVTEGQMRLTPGAKVSVKVASSR